MKTSAPRTPGSASVLSSLIVPPAATRRRWLGALLLSGWCCTSAAALPTAGPGSFLPPADRPLTSLMPRPSAPKPAPAPGSWQFLATDATEQPAGPADNPTPDQASAARPGLRQDEPRQWHRRISRELNERVRLGFAAGLMPLQGRAAEVGLTFAAPGSGFRGEAQRRVDAPALVRWYGSVFQVRVLPPLTVHLTTRRLLGNWKGRGWEAGATYEHNLRPGRRPLLLRAGLAYSQQRVRYGFGTYANADARLQLDDVRLDARELGVSLQQRTRALVPQLGLGWAFSRRYELVADLGWQLLRQTRTELHVAEKTGSVLFRRHDDVPLAKAGATVTVDGGAATPPWQLGQAMLSVGLIYRLN
ncbi:hypothetical protein EJV47_11160 [Hymenobacter gummosus]|uniref:Uncharacterized protein n=1 Tax=Hymenobacter gummosus TaxID=1776032 RepID=A0A431U444_9BACT|nr:hypothetical protein [Hymenobacter gummosus]RTQ50185.1 hypothetical protein EJV47_11160 [Hymenobacter gummosus]